MCGKRLFKQAAYIPCAVLRAWEPNTWCKMLGWFTAMESLLRDKHRPVHAQETISSVKTSLTAILHSCESEIPEILIACLSMAATLRKLMWPLLQVMPIITIDDVAPALPHHCSLHELGAPLLMLVKALSACHCSAECRKSRAHCSMASSTNNVDYDGAPEEIVSAGPSEGKSDDASHSNNSSPCRRAPLVHRLMAVTMVSVVQLHHWSSVYTDCAMHTALQGDVLLAVVESLPQPGLRDTVTSLLGKESSATLEGGMDADASWEGYAVGNFIGRLLPGCCHLGCTNLGGVSEAALPTLLCSGCRRVRYCSTECQRAAWVQGGHKGSCGTCIAADHAVI